MKDVNEKKENSAWERLNNHTSNCLLRNKLPVQKLSSSSVIAGSLNGSGVIVVCLTHLLNDNTISTIVIMVDEAKSSKPKTQELVNIIVSYFVSVVLTLMIITFVIWIAGIFMQHQNGGHAVINAITYTISVLIVSCSCAIGLIIFMIVVISETSQQSMMWSSNPQ
jgi:Cu2+-exporting ATPase